MSFPPRPPMGVPPGMMQQSYAFPMGMMPMGMGMMPSGPMMHGSMPVVSAASSVHKVGKKLVPQEIPKDDKKDDKPPVTTVFVGNISERAPDAMIRQMLQRCGNVLSWKRVQGASGKLQAFGFCEYEDPEATLRCIRLLNEWNIAEKKLVVKVDAKTKTLLHDYQAKKRSAGSSDAANKKDQKDGKEKGDEDPPDKSSNEVDENCAREDRVAQAGLDAIMKEYAKDLAKVPAIVISEGSKDTKSSQKKRDDKARVEEGSLDDVVMEAGQKALINREIKTFRDLHKGEEEEPEVDNDRVDRRDERRRRRAAYERELRLERSYKRLERDERSRSRSRSRERERRSKRDRSSRDRSKSRERDRHRDRDADEEDSYERYKLEKKMREKEAAYQERLKLWEARERKKGRENDKEKDREGDRKAEEVKEARRLKEFLEDYDDERDDPKYYKGSALARRLKEREKEKEADNRDRQREKEELDDIKKRLMDEGHPNLEAEMAKIEQEQEEHLLPRLSIDPTEVEEHAQSPETVVEPVKPEEPAEEKDAKNTKMQPTLKPVDIASSVSNSATPLSDEDNDSAGTPPSLDTNESPAVVYGPSMPEEQQMKMGFNSIKIGNSDSPSGTANVKRKKVMSVVDVFNQENDDSSNGAKKRKLVPLDYDKDDKKPTTAEEKRQLIKRLIDQIPTGKEELFAYSLDWSTVDQILMDKRIKPWVNKKIIEYIGEEEPTLTDFICQKVMAHSPPQNILNDVAMVLDEEAEVFVVKMWRLLIYETEAKKAGLVK